METQFLPPSDPIRDTILFIDADGTVARLEFLRLRAPVPWGRASAVAQRDMVGGLKPYELSYLVMVRSWNRAE